MSAHRLFLPVPFETKFEAVFGRKPFGEPFRLSVGFGLEIFSVHMVAEFVKKYVSQIELFQRFFIKSNSPMFAVACDLSAGPLIFMQDVRLRKNLPLLVHVLSWKRVEKNYI